MVSIQLTSTESIMALLHEPEQELQIYALKKLNELVDHFWAEISETVSHIEELYENEKFPFRELAALVVSKVYYHLGDYNESLNFALGAGSLFDLKDSSEFVETIKAQAIDKYTQLRQLQGQESKSAEKMTQIDARLEAIIEKIFDACFSEGQLKQAIGMALEAERLDICQRAIAESKKEDELPTYVRHASLSLVSRINFRNQVLKLLVHTYQGLAEPDVVSMSECWVYLDDASSCSSALKTLISASEKQKMALLAYQVAFNLYDNASQEFLQKIMTELVPATKKESLSNDDVDMTTKSSPSTNETVLENVRSILAGETPIRLELEFLYRNNHVDRSILQTTKSFMNVKMSVHHSAVTFCHAIMQYGTTNDDFLRHNMEFLSYANNWSKFSATAGLGLIHKGQVSESMNLLSPYLPQEGVTGSPFSEGGSLFALGLIHANHGAEAIPYLLTQLKSTQLEVVQHGACLGLGVAGLASGQMEVYEALKAVLFSDSAVAGEAAGLAMGLVLLGSGNATAIDEMLQYAHDTQHEKIIRGLALGIAFINFGKEDNADTVIESLALDKDPLLRYGAMYSIAMSYSGTGNNKMLRRLLHVAVSDANDDVRRAAVIAIGFLLFRQPAQVPRLVQLLSESFNPHVRYGAALALGISCAGTGLQEAVQLLEPLTSDMVDFVRQGALVALSMVLIQHTETTSPKVGHIRVLYEKIIADKHEDVMAKFGAVLSQGIIDAGGRNVTIALQSPSGHSNLSGIVGLALFTQFWYWYPMIHFISLSFRPTALIGLTGDQLKLPKFEVECMARPSTFAYPAPTKSTASAVPDKIAAAVLSTTAKAKARAKRVEEQKRKSSSTMMIDIVTPSSTETTPAPADAPVMTSAATIPPLTNLAAPAPSSITATTTTNSGDTPMAMTDAEATTAGTSSSDTVGSTAPTVANSSDKKSKKKKDEPISFSLANLSRVVPFQWKSIQFSETSRFVPLVKNFQGGVMVLVDTKPGESVEYLEDKNATEPAEEGKSKPSGSGLVTVPAPPAPFEYSES